MSWSVQFAGKPKNIVNALKEHSSKLEGLSKEEYDEALPHLIAIVEMNHSKSYPDLSLKLEAGGHAYSQDGVKQDSHCYVSINSSGLNIV